MNRLWERLEERARTSPSGEFARCGSRTMMNSEALSESARRAAKLRRLGVETGDRVALLSRNGIDFVLLVFAAIRIGAVPVPINRRLAPPEWVHILNDAQPTIVAAGSEFLEALEPLRGELKTAPRCIALDELSNAAADNTKLIERNTSFDPSADAIQMYSSGTTGHPKGAVHTHAAVLANLSQLAAVAPLDPGDRYLIVAPMYHAAAMITMLHAAASGATLVLQRDFRPAETVRVLAEDRVTATLLVPAMIHACMATVLDLHRRKFPDLRLIAYGGSPMAPELLRQAIDAFGCDFAARYGTTESLVMTWLPPESIRRALNDEPRLLESAGRPLPGVELMAVDQHGRALPLGEKGELVVRGPQVMRGYWNQPQATSEVFRDGWLRTGDIGQFDGDGHVYLVDRAKDMIVSGGENIYPHEIEDVVRSHPAVSDVAIIGVPDDKWGETVMAFIVPRPGATVAAESVESHCRKRLGGYKVPRCIEFVDHLPRNSAGKVLKRELRAPYWAGHARQIS